MPRKRCKKRNNPLSQLQKQDITKRLMAISLRVDKYIYKHKPISISEAEMYMQEVIHYKIQCFRDARSLQVIEKLTRCMTTIIEELKSNTACSVDSESLLAQNQNFVSCAASPVYSLADEDRTQMNEFADDHLITNEIVEAGDVGHNVAPTLKEKLPLIAITLMDISGPSPIEIQAEHNKGSTISDKTANCTENNKTNNKENPEITIDLTLDEEYDNDDLTCSQSLLNNIEIAHAFMTTSTNVNVIEDICAQDIGEIDRELKKIMENEHATTISRKLNYKESTSKLEGKLSAAQPFEPITIMPKEVESFQIQNVFSEISKTQCMQLNKSKNKPNKINNVNKLTKIKTVDKKKTQIDLAKNKNIKKRGKKSKVVDNCSNINDSTANALQTTGKTFNPVIKYSTETCIRRTHTPNQLPRTPHANEIAMEKKQHIHDDLSWIENIRYVREITVEEYDHTLNSLIDSFWENCHLPENWNDEEFE